MNKTTFWQQWHLHYPNTPLISHVFKDIYPDRWLRIHSLPQAKRYAENPSEWNMLLARQNQLFSDLLGNHQPVYLITGDFYYGGEKGLPDVLDKPIFSTMTFTALDALDLFQALPDFYDEGIIFRPYVTEIRWQHQQHNLILKEIANDRLRATFFLSFDKNLIIAPYDGGVDVILPDKASKVYYQKQYQDWLSHREDGL